MQAGNSGERVVSGEVLEEIPNSLHHTDALDNDETGASHGNDIAFFAYINQINILYKFYTLFHNQERRVQL